MKIKRIFCALLILLFCAPRIIYAQSTEEATTIVVQGQAQENQNNQISNSNATSGQTEEVTEISQENTDEVSPVVIQNTPSSQTDSTTEVKQKESLSAASTTPSKAMSLLESVLTKENSTSNEKNLLTSNNTEENNSSNQKNDSEEITDIGNKETKEETEEETENTSAIPGTLSLDTSLKKITDENKDQTFIISYKEDTNSYSKATLTLYFDKGFQVNSCYYDELFGGDDIQIDYYGWDGSYSDNPEDIASVQSIVITKENPDSNTIEGLSIQGSYQEELGSPVSMTASFLGTTESGEDVSAEKTVKIPYLFFHYDVPELYVESDELSYGESTRVIIDNINGKGTDKCSSYKISWIFPTNVSIDSIKYPNIQGAECEIAVNNSILSPDDSGMIYPSSNGGKIILYIHLPDDSDNAVKNFKQTVDMEINLSNVTKLEREIAPVGEGSIQLASLENETFQLDPISLILHSTKKKEETPPDVIDDTTNKDTDAESIDGSEKKEEIVQKEETKEPAVSTTQEKETTVSSTESSDTDETTKEIGTEEVTKKEKKEEKREQPKKNPISSLVDKVSEKSLLSNTDSLIDSVGTGLISSAVEDVDTETEEDKDISPKVEEDTTTKVKHKVKEKVKENRSIQLFLGFMALLAVAIAGLALFIRKLSKDEEADIEHAAKEQKLMEKDEKEREIAKEQKKKFEERKNPSD